MSPEDSNNIYFALNTLDSAINKLDYFCSGTNRAYTSGLKMPELPYPMPPPIKQEIQTFDYKKESIFNNKKRNKSWHGTGSCSSLG